MAALPSRILVISLRRFGDLLLTTPLIRSLRRAWPDSEIDVLVFANTAGIVAGNPDINHVISMPERPAMKESARLFGRLWRHYDIAVSTQSGDRPTIFAFAAARLRAGVTTNDDPWLARMLKSIALQRSIPATDKLHRVEQMLRLADVLEIARVTELVCPAAAPTSPLVDCGNYALIHAAPMFTYKEWTPEGWRTVAAGLRKRGLSVVAIGGPGEAERRYLEEVWRGVAAVYQVEWPGLMNLLAKARVYIGPDTSVTHLAAAAGCKTVALFGPTDPRVWGPWPVGGLERPWQASGMIQNRGNVWIVQNPLPCMPCTFEGCERHIRSRSTCLDELMPAQVLAAADQALA
ncbi:MAG TPA: glycosyltransferase family 9 protein [Pseudolabrys sp.]|jgi:heptosyltransferase-3|nr:glycosyltransferase family 9 protein [Pseudolabrys sp.]